MTGLRLIISKLEGHKKNNFQALTSCEKLANFMVEEFQQNKDIINFLAGGFMDIYKFGWTDNAITTFINRALALTYEGDFWLQEYKKPKYWNDCLYSLKKIQELLNESKN